MVESMNELTWPTNVLARLIIYSGLGRCRWLWLQQRSSIVVSHLELTKNTTGSLAKANVSFEIVLQYDQCRQCVYLLEIFTSYVYLSSSFQSLLCYHYH